MKGWIKKTIIAVVVVAAFVVLCVLLSMRKVDDFHAKYADTDLNRDVAGMERAGTYTGYMNDHADAKLATEDIDVDIFEQMLDLNCISHLICIQKVLPNMIEKGHGNIVNILSSCCKYDNPTIGAYTASKKAMEALSDTLRKEVKDKGIVVTAIYPGGVDTNFRTINRDDYLRADTIADAIVYAINNKDGLLQEIVVRPVVENNY